MKFLKTTIGVLLWTASLGSTIPSQAADFVVYGIQKELDMGYPGVTPQKDFYVNMGSAQGLHSGATLEVFRKMSTYDVLAEKLYREVLFPIARVKIIHVESNAAIARLDKMLPADKTPVTIPPAIMLGDVVRPAQD